MVPVQEAQRAVGFESRHYCWHSPMELLSPERARVSKLFPSFHAVLVTYYVMSQIRLTTGSFMLETAMEKCAY